ncbi:hypothetical protein PROFUN_00199 [Planoprotostelium fungivorum]|uniref:Spindle pole body component n=1 Tax=Planoprotostelium fungivorum TaxID=1890364 RepID=A0A2P6P0Z4_9EUKA|nr:hypothetical protein PROFUN_00199 [Planoprotostelium fungivorum]
MLRCCCFLVLVKQENVFRKGYMFSFLLLGLYNVSGEGFYESRDQGRIPSTVETADITSLLCQPKRLHNHQIHLTHVDYLYTLSYSIVSLLPSGMESFIGAREVFLILITGTKDRKVVSRCMAYVLDLVNVLPTTDIEGHFIPSNEQERLQANTLNLNALIIQAHSEGRSDTAVKIEESVQRLRKTAGEDTTERMLSILLSLSSIKEEKQTILSEIESAPRVEKSSFFSSFEAFYGEKYSSLFSPSGLIHTRDNSNFLSTDIRERQITDIPSTQIIQPITSTPPSKSQKRRKCWNSMCTREGRREMERTIDPFYNTENRLIITSDQFRKSISSLMCGNPSSLFQLMPDGTFLPTQDIVHIGDWSSDGSVRNMLSSFARMGSKRSRLIRYTSTLMNDSRGFIGTSLSNCVRRELLREQMRLDETLTPSDLTLPRVFHIIDESQKRTEWMHSLCVMMYYHQDRKLFSSVFEECVQPFWSEICDLIFLGKFNPYGDLCDSSGAIKILPTFLDDAVGRDIATCSEYVHLISHRGDENIDLQRWNMGMKDYVEEHPTEPFEMVLHHCLVSPVHERMAVLNEKVLRYVMDELECMKHIQSLRSFLLLAAGEFNDSFCTKLFTRCQEPRPVSVYEMNDIFLRSINESSVRFGVEHLSLRVDTMDILTNEQLIDALHLRYQIDYPMDHIIDDRLMRDYNKIFRLLLKMKRVEHCLSRVWSHLKNEKDGNGHTKRVHMIRHKMHHLMMRILGYVIHQIHNVHWDLFLTEVRGVRDRVQLMKAHEKYVDHMCRSCLLDTPVMKMLEKLFYLVTRFHDQVILLPSIPQRGEKEKENNLTETDGTRGIESVWSSFHVTAETFITVVGKVHEQKGNVDTEALLAALSGWSREVT